MTDKPELKVVGEIKPPEYKDPVQMLRNLANNIESGDYGNIQGIAVVTANDEGAMDMFAGGKYSDLHSVAFLFGAAQNAMFKMPFGA